MYQLTNSRRRHLYSAPSFVDDLLRKHCLVGLPILNGFLAAKLPTSTDLCSPFNLRDCGKMQASLFACAAECRRAPEPCRCGTLHRKSGRADCDSVWSVCREFPHAPGDARSPNEAPTVATKPSSARSSGTCAWNMFRGSVLHGTTLLRSAIPARLLLHVAFTCLRLRPEGFGHFLLGPWVRLVSSPVTSPVLEDEEGVPWQGQTHEVQRHSRVIPPSV